MRCLKCGDPVRDAAELDGEAERSRQLAARLDADMARSVIERSSTRTELERAGFCFWHAVETRDNARDGAQGAN